MHGYKCYKIQFSRSIKNVMVFCFMSTRKKRPTEFLKLAELSEQIMATTKRLEKMDLVGAYLQSLPNDEIEPASLLLIGLPFPRGSKRTLDISWSSLWDLIKELLNPKQETVSKYFRQSGDIGEVIRRLYVDSGGVSQKTLFSTTITIPDVYKTLESIADVGGSGARRKKAALLRSLFTRATALEAKYLAKILVGDQRIGFSEGMLESTISRVFKIPLPLVRRANMLMGNIGTVAYIAKVDGIIGLKQVKLKPFTPLLPMLAAQARDIKDVFDQHEGESAFEMKLDGARVQIHLQQKNGEHQTRIFSRRLTDVTISLPDIVTLVNKEIKASSCILEGEVLAVGPKGRPYPFQHLMRRFRRVHDVEQMVKEIPVTLYLFELLMLDNDVLIDTPYILRRKRLKSISGKIPLVPQLVTKDPEKAKQFFEVSIQQGYEGLVAKRLDSLYNLGIRGKAWLKVKRTMESLDLVIIAAEYGTGRRHKWLSNYHLAAWDPETNQYQMLGKTFKGLTDDEFEEITQRLLSLKTDQRRNVVFVRPQIVVETEYDEIQKSPTYKSGMALRFARIKRIRYDKSPKEADTFPRVLELYKSQFKRKAPIKKAGRTRK